MLIKKYNGVLTTEIMFKIIMTCVRNSKFNKKLIFEFE